MRNPHCKRPHRTGPCIDKCCSELNCCVYGLHSGEMLREDADAMFGFEAAAVAAACHGNPHATWQWSPTVVLITVRKEAYDFELGYVEHTVTWGTLVDDLMRVDLCSSASCDDVIDTMATMRRYGGDIIVVTPMVLASFMFSPPLPRVALLRSRVARGLDSVIVILARHLYREVSIGPVCNIRYHVKTYIVL